MNLFVFILIYIFITSVDSKEQILNCQESVNSDFASFGTEFTKIIDFKNRTLSNTSGSYNIFDKVVLFGRNEIILQNRIFDTFSTYNISKKIWTIYGNKDVKSYECFEGKYNSVPLW